MALLASLPPWSLIAEVLRTLVLPSIAAAAAVYAIVCALTKSERIRTVGAAVALLAGLFAGNHFHHLVDWWPTPLMRGWRSLLPVISMVICAGTLLTMLPSRMHWAIGAGLRLLVAAASAWFLLEPLAPLTRWTTFGVLLAGMICTWEISRLVFPLLPRRGSLPVLVGVWGGAAATILIFAHSARFSDLAALLTTSLCAVGLAAAVWKQDLAFLLPAPCVFFPGLLLAGAANTYSEVPVTAFAGVAFAPSALLLVFLPQIRRLPLRALTAMAVTALLIPCAAGVALAARFESLDYGE